MQILCFQRLAVDKDAVCDFTKEELAELARQLVLETDAHPPAPLEADGYGFLLSFWMYPKGEALSFVLLHYFLESYVDPKQDTWVVSHADCPTSRGS